MKTTGRSRLGLLGLSLLLLFTAHAVIAATAQDVLDTDLTPLIDQSARYPTRFAVDLRHPVSMAGAGNWTQSGGLSTWTYSVRVPTAVSLSFHAANVNFPAGAVLKVTGANGTSATYRARDIGRSGLWSRPLAGDSLLLSLTVATTARPQTVLEIESFQAGYRSLGGGVPDNPHFRSLMQKGAQTGSGCTVNYACETNSQNQGPGGATVAIIVGGLTECTGTLLNDTSSDGTPYVLTARHCENGVLGGGDPGAAANVTVYWDAVTPCGSALGSIYSGNPNTQTGATTVVEQQDAWLIKLDALPAANDAYYAGWDATGSVFSGGYSIHHALGYDKQYVAWYGQPILQSVPGTTLQVGYASTFWGLVNSLGSVGAGASGGALFDSNNNAVGSGTLAQLVSGPNSAGVCPVASPPAPSPATITAMYTALSGVWNSNADTTSTTGTATLESVLDAANTGKLVNGGMAYLPVTFTANTTTASTGQMVSLTWSAPGAQSCTASGGLSGDGWGGTLAASGTLALTEQSGSAVTYAIHCTGTNQAASASLTVTWQLVPAFVQIAGSGPTAAAGREVLLQWTANTQPCTASGGTSGDGWAGSKASNGSQSVLASEIGSVTYTLTCGTGSRTATNQYTITVVAPSVSTITNDANNMLVGQAVNLQFGGGGSCVASGGATGDGWAGSLATSTANSGPLGYTVPVTETAAGTYTYTVTCSGAGATAGLSATSSVTLTFTNTPPTVLVSASPATAEVYTDPGATTGNDTVNVGWTSNVRPCAVVGVGPGNAQYTTPAGQTELPTETVAENEAVAGLHTYTVTCGSGANQAQASASATYYTNAPAVTLNVPNTLPLGMPVPISWNYNVYPCTGTGGQSGDGWSGGPKAAEAFGAARQAVTESVPGTVTFGITCGSGAQIVQAQATASVVAPQASITASASTLPVDGILLLTWSSNFEPCTSTITPGSAGGWGTVLPKTGSFQTSQAVAGTYTYTINCEGAQASTQVTFTGSLVTLTASESSVGVDTPVTLTWNSPPNTTSCTAAGGSVGDGWTGSLARSGIRSVTEVTAATVTYSISCDFGYGPAQAQTEVTYTSLAAGEPATPTPQVKLSTSASSQVVGSSISISWSSQNASACVASGGSGDDGWSGSLPLSGNMPVTESTAGSFDYGITCTGAPPAAAASTEVNFTVAAVTVTASGGKSGGGGALDLLSLALLGLLVCRRMQRRLSEAA